MKDDIIKNIMEYGMTHETFWVQVYRFVNWEYIEETLGALKTALTKEKWNADERWLIEEASITSFNVLSISGSDKLERAVFDVALTLIDFSIRKSEKTNWEHVRFTRDVFIWAIRGNRISMIKSIVCKIKDTTFASAVLNSCIYDLYDADLTRDPHMVKAILYHLRSSRIILNEFFGEIYELFHILEESSNVLEDDMARELFNVSFPPRIVTLGKEGDED